MKQRLKIIFLMMGVFSCNIFALEINSKNLKSLLEQKNARISASEMQVEAAKVREGVLARSFLPSVKLSASQESFKTGIESYKTQPTYGVEGNINLFNGGRDKLESTIRSKNTELQLVQKDQVIYSELQKVRTIYWDIIYLINKKELFQSAIEINKSNAKSAQRRIKSGVATETDRVEFEMEAINLQRELRAAELQLTNNINSLMVVLNLDVSEKLEFPEKLIHDHEFESLMNHGVKDLEFAFKNSQLNSQIHILQAEKEKRALWPKVDAFASYNQYNQREKDFQSNFDRDEYAIGIKLTVDLPSGIESNREAASQSYQANSAQTLADIQKREIATHIKNEMNELNFLHDQVHDAEENIKRAEKYYQLTQSEYSRGVKNSLDVLGSSQRLYEMRHKKLEIIRDFQLSKGHLLAQFGK